YQDPHKPYFFGNELRELARLGKYNNTSQDWQSRYRSTLIWPIRRAASGFEGGPDLLGFVCVDSRRTKPFSEGYDYPLGATIADVLGLFWVKILNSANELGAAVGLFAGLTVWLIDRLRKNRQRRRYSEVGEGLAIPHETDKPIEFETRCPTCKRSIKLQCRLVELRVGVSPTCPHCQAKVDLIDSPEALIQLFR